MKTAISIPDPLFRAAEKLGKRLRVSRSRLYSQAIERYIQHLDDQALTSKLDEIYEHELSALDSTLASIQARSVAKDSWK